jgi:hypothetical protein
VFGGNNAPINYSRNNGAIYDLLTDTWTIPTNLGGSIGAPEGRYQCAIGWDGDVVVVYGGERQVPGLFPGSTIPDPVFTGGVYRPATDTWLPSILDQEVSTPHFTGAQRANVWTGTSLVARGGSKQTRSVPNVDGTLPAGGVFNTGLLDWELKPNLRSGSLALPRSRVFAVWTGEWWLEWGGVGVDTGGDRGFTDGLLYELTTDLFLSRPNLNNTHPVLAQRTAHLQFWTGTHLLTWGGAGKTVSGGGQPIYTPIYSDGAVYDPVTDQWSYPADLNSGPNNPGPIGLISQVYTGDRVLAWGTNDPSTSPATRTNTGAVYHPPRGAPTSRNLGPGDVGGSAANPIVLQIGERLKHRIVCYGTPEAIVIPSNLPSWLTVGFGGPTQLVAAGTGQGNGGQNGEPPGTGAPFNPWFSAEGGTADGQWLHGTPRATDIGTYAIQLHAHNGVAPDTGIHTLYIEVPAPPVPASFTSPPPTGPTVAGELFTATVTTDGTPPVTSITMTGHPWLSISNGVITGVPPVSAGGTTQGPFILTASNGQSPDAVQVFNLAVDHAYTDINRDRAVNVTDVQLTVNIILGLAQPQWQGQGDANRDSTVNVVDVQTVVNKILNP